MVRLSRPLQKIDIEPYLPALKRFFARRQDILAVYLYGSYGAPAQTPLSDVDLGVLLAPQADNKLDTYLEIQAAVCDITGQDDVNILILNRLPVIMQFHIVSSGNLIYERNEEATSDFLERVFKLYGDFITDYRAFCAEYDTALREAYLDGKQR